MKPSFPLASTGTIAVVHHRKLNTPEGLDSVLPALEAYPEYLHAAEGDLCWSISDDEVLLYMHHPDRVYDTLSPSELARAASEGELWTLEAALDERYRDLLFVVELKTGRGPRARAIAAAVDLLQRRRPGRFWFDTFTLADNRAIKAADPDVATSLHTKALSSKRVLETAPTPLRVSYPRLDTLASTDILTLTYKTSPQRLFGWAGASLQTTVRQVHGAGKIVVCGGVGTPRMFEEVCTAGARGAYIKFPWERLPRLEPGAEG